MARWLPRVLSRVRRLAAERRVRFTHKAHGELAALGLVILRSDCVVVSFHEDEGGCDEEEEL